MNAQVARFRSQKENITYKKAVQALETKYAPPDLQEKYKVEFAGRTQKPGESLDDYATSLQALGAKAYPYIPNDLLGENIVRTFREGLLDPTLKQKLWEGLSQTQTLNEHLSMGRRLQMAHEKFADPRKKIQTPAYVGHVGAGKAPEETRQRPKPKPKSRPSGANSVPTNTGNTQPKQIEAQMTSYEQKLQDLERRLSQMNSAMANPPPPAPAAARASLCYRCGSADHWISTCPFPDNRDRAYRRGGNSQSSRGGGNSNGKGRGNYRRRFDRRDQGGGRKPKGNDTGRESAPQAQPQAQPVREEARAAAPVQSPPVSQAVQVSSPGNA